MQIIYLYSVLNNIIYSLFLVESGSNSKVGFSFYFKTCRIRPSILTGYF